MFSAHVFFTNGLIIKQCDEDLLIEIFSKVWG